MDRIEYFIEEIGNDICKELSTWDEKEWATFLTKVKGEKCSLKKIAEFITQLEKPKILSANNLIIELREEAKQKAQKRKEDIENGEKLPHWNIINGAITCYDKTKIPTLKFKFVNDEIESNAHYIHLQKDFAKIYFTFPYDNEMMIKIRGEKGRRGVKSGGIEGAKWEGFAWSIPFSKANEILEWENLSSPYCFWKEVIEYGFKIHKVWKQQFTDLGTNADVVNGFVL